VASRAFKTNVHFEDSGHACSAPTISSLLMAKIYVVKKNRRLQRQHVHNRLRSLFASVASAKNPSSEELSVSKTVCKARSPSVILPARMQKFASLQLISGETGKEGACALKGVKTIVGTSRPVVARPRFAQSCASCDLAMSPVGIAQQRHSGSRGGIHVRGRRRTS